MREIGSVADDLDVGGIVEGIFSNNTLLGNADFCEAGAITESTYSNLLYRWWYGDVREAGATRVFIKYR